MARNPYPYFIRDKVCGEVAYFLTRKLSKGNALTVDALVNFDGSKTVAGEPLRCGSCLRLIKSGMNNEIEVVKIAITTGGEDGIPAD